MDPHTKQCPECQGKDLWWMSTQIEGWEVHVYLSCLKCGYQFYEIYALQFSHLEKV